MKSDHKGGPGVSPGGVCRGTQVSPNTAYLNGFDISQAVHEEMGMIYVGVLVRCVE